MRTHSLPFLLVLAIATTIGAAEYDLQVEAGGVWFSRNDVRIPGDDGTRFSMLDLTGRGPHPTVRIAATHAFNPRHALRVTYAPLHVDGTGTLRKTVAFNDDVFDADTPTTGSYTFNTWRLTYRWTFHDHERWRWSVGVAALIRDADITLEQGAKKQSRDDLGAVPLLHARGEYRHNERLHGILDVEGAWSPMGRALDVAAKIRYTFDSGWHVGAGYRMLEGGADNDDVYTFAWLHFACIETGWRF